MKAKVIMVASGKGGTGKSTVSVLLGAGIGALGKNVLLVELDSGLRSVDIIAGVYGKTVYDIQDVLCGRCNAGKAVVESSIYPGLSVISAPYEGGEVTVDGLKRLVQALSPHFDCIIIDTAAGMGAPFHSAAAVSDRALLVLTADPVALRDGRIVSDALFDMGVREMHLVVNRVAARSFAEGAVRDLDECIDTVCAQLIAVLPESPALQMAAAKGEGLSPKEPVYRAAMNLARRVLGQRVPLLIR